MKKFFKALAALVVVLIVAFILGPRPDTSQDYTFDADAIGDDIDAYLARSESAHTDIRDGLQKGIVWANPQSHDMTPYSIVYVHGFSASRVEVDPVPRNVARALNANLFFTRLAGHGRSGDAMAEASLSDWFADMAEALTIGKRIGDRVIVMSGSTGGTLSVWAASRPELAGMINGLVMISPNFAVQGASTTLLNLPWAETVLPMVMGQRRSWEPSNEGHAHGWTTEYPSSAVFTMGALLKISEGIDPSSIQIPALFIYSTKDTVIVPERIEEVAARWGGDREILIVDDSDNPDNHVIAGDILSPNTTARVSDAAIEWARKL